MEDVLEIMHYRVQRTFTHEKRAGNGFVCRYLFVMYLEDKRIVYDEADTSGTTMKKIR